MLEKYCVLQLEKILSKKKLEKNGKDGNVFIALCHQILKSALQWQININQNSVADSHK